MRFQQQQLLTAVLARLANDSSQLPTWSLEQIKLTGLATGLTALADHLELFDRTEPEVAAYLDDQRAEVAQRVQQFRELSPVVLGALLDASIPAVLVKGAALLVNTWGVPETRPMADIDVVIDPRYRAQASAALVRAGLRPPVHQPLRGHVFGLG